MQGTHPEESGCSVVRPRHAAGGNGERDAQRDLECRYTQAVQGQAYALNSYMRTIGCTHVRRVKWWCVITRAVNTCAARHPISWLTSHCDFSPPDCSFAARFVCLIHRDVHSCLVNPSCVSISAHTSARVPLHDRPLDDDAKWQPSPPTWPRAQRRSHTAICHAPISAHRAQPQVPERPAHGAQASAETLHPHPGSRRPVSSPA